MLLEPVPAGVPVVPVVSVADGVGRNVDGVPDAPALDESAAKPTEGLGSLR